MSNILSQTREIMLFAQMQVPKTPVRLFRFVLGVAVALSGLALLSSQFILYITLRLNI